MEEVYETTHLDYHNRVEYECRELHENLQIVLYSFIAFGMPFFLGHPQFLVGSVVNMMLILGAQNLKGTKLFAMIFTPSLGVVSAGLLFGGLTKFVVYLMPMIWISNMILVYGYKYFRHHFKLNQVISVSVSLIAKVLLLAGNAYLLISFDIIPEVFMTAMSVLQLTTGIIGAIAALSVTKFIVSRFAKPE